MGVLHAPVRHHDVHPSETPMIPGLRDGMLTGAHTAPGWPFDRFASFLRETEGALASWFGDLAPCPDPSLRREQLRGMIDRDIARIDRLIARQLDAVLHHPRVQRLEGSWRGLAGMVARADPNAGVVIRVLPARWDELARDLDRAIEFDQSVFFRLIYENEFGHAGGEPFGLLVIDHEISHRPSPRTVGSGAPIDDIMVLTQLCAIVAAAFVPTVLAVSPSMFDADRFSDLALSQDLSTVLDDEDHMRWRAFTRKEDSRFLCATMPRVLARPAWSRERTGGWYEEHAPDEARRCWSSAGYALAETVLRAQMADRWPADIRGVSTGRIGGGLVTGLVQDDFSFGACTTLPRAGTDLVLTDSQEQALVAASFIPLNMLPYGEAAFGAVRSLQMRPSLEAGRRTTPQHANRRVSAEINALLCVSRFAHYVKVIGRDLIGRQTTPAEVERLLGNWLRGYTNSNVTSDAGNRARHPLLSSRVQVAENAGRPGSYACIIHLQPFHQLDDVSTTFRLTTNLPLADGAQLPFPTLAAPF